MTLKLGETINILVNKAFTDDWFLTTYGFSLHKDQLVKLLEIATTNKLFQFDVQLYEQTDGVAMGSPFGPIANGERLHVPPRRETHMRWFDARLLTVHYFSVRS